MTVPRRRFLQLATASAGLAIAAGCNRPATDGGAAAQPTLGVGGSLILLALPIAYLIEKSPIRDLVREIEFFPIRNHDQIRALFASGQTQLSANPTTVAAGLHRSGVPLKLLNAMVWGNIYLISPDRDLATWDDLRGKTVAIPFQGSLPETLFRFLAGESGLAGEGEVPSAENLDLAIQSPPDFQTSAQLLIAGQSDAAVFAEPQATQAIAKAREQGLDLHYNLDFQETWGRVTGKPPRFPQAGFSLDARWADERPALTRAIETELAESLDWIRASPAEAAALGAKYLDLPAPVVERSLARNQFDCLSARDARPELEFFYRSLLQANPQMMGGQLPPPEFYAGTPT